MKFVVLSFELAYPRCAANVPPCLLKHLSSLPLFLIPSFLASSRLNYLSSRAVTRFASKDIAEALFCSWGNFTSSSVMGVGVVREKKAAALFQTS
jgi:hypothetical protein